MNYAQLLEASNGAPVNKEAAILKIIMEDHNRMARAFLEQKALLRAANEAGKPFAEYLVDSIGE